MIIWTESLWKFVSYRHLHEGMSACMAHVTKFQLYLCSPCLAVNKSMFSTQILLKYLPPVLAIISGTFVKISNVFHDQCSFYEKFNIPTIFKVTQKWWSHENVRRTMFSSYFIWMVILVTECSFLLKTIDEWYLNIGWLIYAKFIWKWVTWMFSPVFFRPQCVL